jgi:CheY-like chemotaxis protein
MTSEKVNCILLIDDNPIQNYLNLLLLKSLNISETVRVCLNGKEALEFIVQYLKDYGQIPELIIVDLNMPVLNGYEFITSFNKYNFNKENTKIVVLTAITEQTEIDRIKEVCPEIIFKPLTEEKIYNILKINPSNIL